MANSSNSNSSAQFHTIQREIDVLDLIPSSSSPIIIADYGCAHGSNSIYAMKWIVDYLKQINRSFWIILNDSSSNDWSTVFHLLNDDQTYFGLANGRSFDDQYMWRIEIEKDVDLRWRRSSKERAFPFEWRLNLKHICKVKIVDLENLWLARDHLVRSVEHFQICSVIDEKNDQWKEFLFKQIRWKNKTKNCLKGRRK